MKINVLIKSLGFEYFFGECETKEEGINKVKEHFGDDCLETGVVEVFFSTNEEWPYN